MSPNIFSKRLLGPSASQLRHKQRKMDSANSNHTSTTTLELSAKLLPIWNGILMSLMNHNSQGNMVVWLDCCVIKKSFLM